MLGLAFIQNISFSLVGRARNRNKMWYHAGASVLSNGIWYLTFSHLIALGMGVALFFPYCVGTVLGSLTGARIAMWIERVIGASSDAHVKPETVSMEAFTQMDARVKKLSLQITAQVEGRRLPHHGFDS